MLLLHVLLLLLLHQHLLLLLVLLYALLVQLVVVLLLVLLVLTLLLVVLVLVLLLLLHELLPLSHDLLLPLEHDHLLLLHVMLLLPLRLDVQQVLRGQTMRMHLRRALGQLLLYHCVTLLGLLQLPEKMVTTRWCLGALGGGPVSAVAGVGCVCGPCSAAKYPALRVTTATRVEATSDHLLAEGAAQRAAGATRC
jgi:hypothetical protein